VIEALAPRRRVVTWQVAGSSPARGANYVEEF
jgi:hypothetical protein